MEEKEADIKIEFEHSENPDTKKIIDGLKSFIKEQKKKGNIDFVTRRIRKCDYCGRTLTEKDKFTTIKDGNNILDKCEDCEKAGKQIK